MTRSWWFGDQPPADFTQIKNLVDEAYSLTLEQLQQPSITVTAQILDETARTFISQAGFGQEFIHTTGHGVGLDIHEPPSLYWKNKQPILPGMIITIEPGIYLPERFGYRWENTVLITDTGCQELTK
jgi:Xaa-Pro aminopeptidase